MTIRPVSTAGRAGVVFYIVMMTVALAIGALQMFHVRAGFLTNYGADLFGTAWLYGMFRQGRTIFQRGREMTAEATAGFIFGACAASECAQRFQLFPGVFDPVDLIAFGVGVLACYAVDRRVNLGVAR